MCLPILRCGQAAGADRFVDPARLHGQEAGRRAGVEEGLGERVVAGGAFEQGAAVRGDVSCDAAALSDLAHVLETGEPRKWLFRGPPRRRSGARIFR